MCVGHLVEASTGLNSFNFRVDGRGFSRIICVDPAIDDQLEEDQELKRCQERVDLQTQQTVVCTVSFVHLVPQRMLNHVQRHRLNVEACEVRDDEQS